MNSADRPQRLAALLLILAAAALLYYGYQTSSPAILHSYRVLTHHTELRTP